MPADDANVCMMLGHSLLFTYMTLKDLVKHHLLQQDTLAAI